MRNGTTGRVAAVRLNEHDPAHDEIDITTADGTLTCPRAVFDRPRGGVDLAYSVTSYTVQGSTRDVSTSTVTPTTNRSELYVDITRGRHNNQLYGTRPVEGADDLDEHLPTLQQELTPVLRTRLARGIDANRARHRPARPDHRTGRPATRTRRSARRPAPRW